MENVHNVNRKLNETNDDNTKGRGGERRQK